MVEFRSTSSVQGRPLSFQGPTGINNVRFRACSVKDSVYDDKFRNVRYHTVAVTSADGRPPANGATEHDEAAYDLPRPSSAGAAAVPPERGEEALSDGEGRRRREEISRKPPLSSASSTTSNYHDRFGIGGGGGGAGGSGGGCLPGRNGGASVRGGPGCGFGAGSGFSFPQDFSRRESSPPVDAAVIKRIRSTSDLYEILGVPSNADEACLKRAYRKLALHLHPDKNDADGAAEAFKSVSNAFAILSDADKRRKYDNWSKANKWRKKNSGDAAAASNAAASRREAWVKRGTGTAKPTTSTTTTKDDFSDDGDDAAKFHSDISAEELFNMFFGTGNKGRNDENVHVHRAQHRQQEGDSWSGGGSLFLHLLPVLLLFVLSTTSNLFAGESPYSLKPSNKYPEARTTKKLEIPYFVKADFKKRFKKSRIPQIEEEIEEDFVSTLKGKCEKEQKKRDIEEGSNRKTNDRKRQHPHNHAHNNNNNNNNDHKTPSCELLRRVNLAGYYVNS